MEAPPRSSPPPSSSSRLPGPVMMRGIAASPGVAVGIAVVVGDARSVHMRRHIHSAQIEPELERIRQAVTRAQASLRVVAGSMTADHGQAAILDAYLLMLADPMLHGHIERHIRTEKKCAEWAVALAAEDIARAFHVASQTGGRGVTDSYIAERRHDVEFVADRLLRALMGEPDTIIPRLDRPAILVARDLSPADTAGMVKEPALGFVTVIGSRTSHTAIMARALEIPAVVGVAEALSQVQSGDTLIIDGIRGEVVVHPTQSMIAEAESRSARHLAFAKNLLASRDRPCKTSCGETISLKANVELPAEAVLALDHGADGIGLYRTEFLYIDRTDLPSEEEQYEVYRSIVQTVAPRPATLRTFDIGGDKFASSFDMPAEMNPALGLRAVRLALATPEVFLTQLRAMVRASAHGDVRIMVPMIASLFEVREVKRLLREAIKQVDAKGQAHAERVALGIMIEVPAAAVMADVLARNVDFFSLGTNDLVQYSLAVDRTSRSLAHLASPMDPAILRLIDQVARAAEAQGIPLAICGAMASDPLAAPLLLGLGLRELSMEAAAIPEIKTAVGRMALEECRALAREALVAETADDVEELVAQGFAPRLFDLLTGSEED